MDGLMALTQGVSTDIAGVSKNSSSRMARNSLCTAPSLLA